MISQIEIFIQEDQSAVRLILFHIYLFNFKHFKNGFIQKHHRI